MSSIIATPLGYVFNIFYGLLGNYGLTIIIFTILFRLCIFPLYAAQLKSTSKMSEVQPKVQEIQKKYASDRETMNMKVMELYKEEKVNPTMGCLPLLIQFPIIIGLFALLRNPTEYISNPNMILAVHESFLWIKDLSQPDLWILPILSGVATYFSTRLTSSSSDAMGSNPSMKVMLYFMPVMIVWMGRSFPAGLCLYWVVSSLFQVGQAIITRAVKKRKQKVA